VTDQAFALATDRWPVTWLHLWPIPGACIVSWTAQIAPWATVTRVSTVLVWS